MKRTEVNSRFIYGTETMESYDIDDLLDYNTDRNYDKSYCNGDCLNCGLECPYKRF